jgi:hypothetical protein
MSGRSDTMSCIRRRYLCPGPTRHMNNPHSTDIVRRGGWKDCCSYLYMMWREQVTNTFSLWNGSAAGDVMAEAGSASRAGAPWRRRECVPATPAPSHRASWRRPPLQKRQCASCFRITTTPPPILLFAIASCFRREPWYTYTSVICQIIHLDQA